MPPLVFSFIRFGSFFFTKPRIFMATCTLLSREICYLELGPNGKTLSFNYFMIFFIPSNPFQLRSCKSYGYIFFSFDGTPGVFHVTSSHFRSLYFSSYFKAPTLTLHLLMLDSSPLLSPPYLFLISQLSGAKKPPNHHRRIS